MTETILKMQKKVKRYLDKDRYDHTIGVMHTAGCLAMRYGANLEQALTAGLLHDCAKCVPADEKIKLCEKNHIEISDAEYKNPGLLHAKLGAFFAREKYGIENERFYDRSSLIQPVVRICLCLIRLFISQIILSLEEMLHQIFRKYVRLHL